MSALYSLAAWRRDIYGLLSFMYHHSPTGEDLSKILSLSKYEEGLPRVCNLLGRCARRVEEENPQDIRQDFNDLFMVPTSHYVTPYESVYVDTFEGAGGRKTELTFGPSTQKVKAFYTKIGLEISKDYTELPDYIGLELACMEYLCAKEVEFTREGRDIYNICCHERQFLTEHISRWVPQLCKKIKNEAQTMFYKDMADLTEEFIRCDEHSPHS